MGSRRPSWAFPEPTAEKAEFSAGRGVRRNRRIVIPSGGDVLEAMDDVIVVTAVPGCRISISFCKGRPILELSNDWFSHWTHPADRGCAAGAANNNDPVRKSPMPFLTTALALAAVGLLLGSRKRAVGHIRKRRLCGLALAWIPDVCLRCAAPLCSRGYPQAMWTRCLRPFPVLPLTGATILPEVESLSRGIFVLAQLHPLDRRHGRAGLRDGNSSDVGWPRHACDARRGARALGGASWSAA